ncbi:MAG: NADH-quinone oxidoreductase subunit NuoF [Acidobacteria bacterium]|nr:NADH-quinone oxidoreductase subunit NuoF [Acidobacteriota bacterium]
MEPVLTRNVGVEGARTLEVARRRGAYESLRAALALGPDELVARIKASGLRGRGGAGFPTGTKWGFMPKAPTPERPNYLVCNADESEPGTFKDRVIIENDPHLLIEGCLIAACAIRASIAYIYIRGEFTLGAAVLDRAVGEARAAGLIGKNILGSGWDCELHVHRGAGAYICGEETALMTSLEGDRGNPRLKPPFPAAHGVYGKPTTVNNVETLACVPFIVERGVDWFKSLGPDERNTGPKLYCLSGHLKRPGVVELPMGVPLMELIEEHGGGLVRPNTRLKAVIPGGSSVPVLRAEECAGLRMDFDSLVKAGSMLGSAGVIVMDETTDMVLVCERIAHFYAHESCGQCTPCREGTGWLEKIVHRLRTGGGRPGDPALLDSVASHMMGGTTICPLADAAAMPMRSFVAKFREEFDHYILHGRPVTAAAAR